MRHPFAAILIVASAAVAVAPAAALDVNRRGAVVLPVTETNGAIDGIMILCRRDFVIGVITPARRLRPKRDDREEEALFDTVFGKAAAQVDGARFDVGVGGANDEATVYVFAQDRDGLLRALHDGESLTLSFDILPEDAKDGAGFETVATFDIAGISDDLTAAGRACRLSGAN